MTRPRPARRHALAAALVAIAAACAKEDPRIIATFRQHEPPFNIGPALGRANYYYNPPSVAGGYVYIGTSRRFHDAPGPDNFFFKLDLALRKVWEPTGRSRCDPRRRAASRSPPA